MHRQAMDKKIHNFSLRGAALPQVTLYLIHGVPTNDREEARLTYCGCKQLPFSVRALKLIVPDDRTGLISSSLHRHPYALCILGLSGSQLLVLCLTAHITSLLAPPDGVHCGSNGANRKSVIYFYILIDFRH